MKNYSNYKNETFTEITEEVIGCNINDCVIDAEGTPVFSKCNFTNCKFLKPATINLSNLLDCELCDGVVLYKSNNNKSEDELDRHEPNHPKRN